MAYSKYFVEPIGQFGDNTRHAVRIARELCSATESLAARMRSASGEPIGSPYMLLVKCDLDDFSKSYQMLDELLNTEGQAKHLAELHEGDEVKWQDKPCGSYAAATLAMATAIQSELNPDSPERPDLKALVLNRWEQSLNAVTDISKEIESLQAGLGHEQSIVEYLIRTRLGRAPKPSQIDLINAHVAKLRTERRQSRDLERSVKSAVQFGLLSVQSDPLKPADPPVYILNEIQGPQKALKPKWFHTEGEPIPDAFRHSSMSLDYVEGTIELLGATKYPNYKAGQIPCSTLEAHIRKCAVGDHPSVFVQKIAEGLYRAFYNTSASLGRAKQTAALFAPRPAKTPKSAAKVKKSQKNSATPARRTKKKPV